MVIPDLPFDEYRFCVFQIWNPGEVAHLALSLLYGTFFLRLSTARALTSDSFPVKDALAFFIIVYSAKRACRIRVDGVPNLLDTIIRDATTHFLALYAGHLLILFFRLFAPVSNHTVDLCSTAHDKLHTDFD